MTGLLNFKILGVAAIVSSFSAAASTSHAESTAATVSASATPSTTSVTKRTATATSSGSISTPSIIIDTTPYFIDLIGFHGSVDYWGAEGIINDGGVNYSQYFPLRVVDPYRTPAAFNSCNQQYEGTAAWIQHVSTNEGKTSTTLRPRQLVEVILGDNLQVTSENSTCDSFQEVQTVPYGVNVGLDGTYNGSLVLNGWYDSNRIASTSWYLVSESVGNDSFLTTGALQVSILLGNETYDAILDPMAGSNILFPDTFAGNSSNSYRGICANHSTAAKEWGDAGPLVISFPVENSGYITLEPTPKTIEYAGQTRLDIPFAPEILDSCLDDYPATQAVSEITFGLPFLQAAYMYVDAEGHVYLAAANQLNATSVSMEKFDPNATLTLPAGVTVFTPSPTKSLAASRFSPGLSIFSYGLEWNLALIGMLIVLIAN